MNIIVKFKGLLSDQSGATAIEYGMIAAAMGLMMIAVMPAYADEVSKLYEVLPGLFETILSKYN